MIIDVFVSIAVGVLCAIVLFYVFVFARDPLRIVPAIHKNAVLCPAHGRVSTIINSNNSFVHVEKGFIGRIIAMCSDVAPQCKLMSIVMNPLDVHYQYAPCNGIVRKVSYVHGKFSNAVLHAQMPLLENEHNEILIECENGDYIKVIQIAGVLARRIRCFVKESDHISRGKKIGFIDLGSQVMLIVPHSYELLVAGGTRVRGVETVMAYA